MAVKKYIKFDSEKGYLEDKDDINYFSTNQMRKVAFGKMLGDFDENGLYVINSKIVDELIRMPKVIVEIIEGTDLIRSTIKADSFFHFILTVEDNKAQFKLLEKIHYQSNRDFNSGLYSNINEYILDEVIVTDRDFDRNALYQKYNISTENNGEALSIFDMDEFSIALYYNLTEKLKVNYLVQNALVLKEKQLEAIEADYFESVLSALAEFKDFDNQVTSGVKKDLAEKHTFVIVSKPFFQHTVNEVLDSYIDMFIQTLSPEQRREFENKYREIKNQFYEKFKKIIPIEISQKYGVRFDANQILQEGVIGSLVQEIRTKGFTSSDVRKIIINDDELQLSISKIKEIVQQNEDIAKRDNTKARDIIKGREKTTKFYKELEKENNVNVLTPDTTLIEREIQNQKSEKAQIDGNVKDKDKELSNAQDPKQEKDKKEQESRQKDKEKGPEQRQEGQRAGGSSSNGDLTEKEKNNKDNERKVESGSSVNRADGGYDFSGSYGEYKDSYIEGSNRPDKNPKGKAPNNIDAFKRFVDSAGQNRTKKIDLGRFADSAGADKVDEDNHVR